MEYYPSKIEITEFLKSVYNDIFIEAEEKKIDVKIVSSGGQLVITSDETISRVDVFSAIGGMLYNTSANSHEVRIDNLPKSFLVVRVRFANNQTAIYKIRHN